MRKFLIASKKYTGQVEVVYAPMPNLEHFLILESIDFANTSLNPVQRDAFKKLLPVMFTEFEPAMVAAGATVVEDDYTVSFDDYWKLVKKKVNRKRCEDLWARMSKVNQVLAVVNLAKYYKCLNRTGRKEADPETYLKNEYFLTDWDKVN
jgi:hypothetical protein